MSFAADFLAEMGAVLAEIDVAMLDRAAEVLAQVRAAEGRLFVLGVGGSAAIASHAVIDLRKACGFEAYAPTENTAELTARTNDEGWDSVFTGWLRGSRLRAGDGLLIFSVGGGDKENGVSANIVGAIDLAIEVGASVVGVVGKATGYTARHADAAVIVPQLFPARSGPLTLAAASVIEKLLILHPSLQR